MSFKFHHSRHDEAPIAVPSIGLELRVCLPPASSGGALTVIETANAPGFGPPLHRHPETEVFRVLEGRYLFEVNGERFLAETGDVISVPGCIPHAFVNLTDKTTRQLVLILPGMDAKKFFVGLGELTEGGLPDREALNRFGEIWGVEFLGPPIRAD